MALTSIGQDADMLPGHCMGQEANSRLPMWCPGEGHVLATEEVATVWRDEHQELCLARCVAEHLEGLAPNRVGRHRTNLSTW